ncbi:hypothetical protein BST61_g5994 [Cercospora zeina]
MFYAVLEQTIPAHRVALNISDPTTTTTTTTTTPTADDSTRQQPDASALRTPDATPLYTCPWDPTRRLCFAKLASDAAVEQWRRRDVRSQTQPRPGESHRLRLGSPVSPPHDMEQHDDDPSPIARSEGPFLVLYEQALSDRTTPVRHQDIPVLLGPVADEGGEGGTPTSSSCIEVLKGLVDSAVYQRERNLLWLSTWPTQDAALAYVDSIDRVEGDSVGLMRVLRDDRIEASQREMAKW